MLHCNWLDTWIGVKCWDPGSAFTAYCSSPVDMATAASAKALGLKLLWKKRGTDESVGTIVRALA